MLRNMFSIETQKVFRQPMLRIELLTLAAVVIGMQLIMFSITWIMPAAQGAMDAGETQEMASLSRAFVTWPGALIDSLNLAGANGLGGLMIIVLMGAAVTQEYQWRTLHLWLSRGVPRTAYGLARFLSMLLPALLIVVTALLGTALVSMFLHLALEGRMPFDQVRLGALVLAVLRTSYTLLPYAALAFLLAVLTRSAAATIAIGMSILLIVENVLGQMLMLFGGSLARVVAYLPARMANALTQANASLAAGYTGPDPALAEVAGLAPEMAALGLALYTLLFLGLAIWQLYRQDLTA